MTRSEYTEAIEGLGAHPKRVCKHRGRTFVNVDELNQWVEKHPLEDDPAEPEPIEDRKAGKNAAQEPVSTPPSVTTANSAPEPKKPENGDPGAKAGDKPEEPTPGAKPNPIVEFSKAKAEAKALGIEVPKGTKLPELLKLIEDHKAGK